MSAEQSLGMGNEPRTGVFSCPGGAAGPLAVPTGRDDWSAMRFALLQLIEAWVQGRSSVPSWAWALGSCRLFPVSLQVHSGALVEGGVGDGVDA